MWVRVLELGEGVKDQTGSKDKFHLLLAQNIKINCMKSAI